MADELIQSASTDSTPSADASVPDLSPPPAESQGGGESYSAPASQPSFDYDRLARTQAETLRPILQQFAPKPAAPAEPWADRNKFWTLPQGPEANEQFHQRLEQVIEARVKSALEGFEQKVGTALQGRDAYFKQTFAVDPNFQRLQTHFDRYVQQGVPPEHAKRLAQLDAGMIGNGAPQGQPAAGAQGRSMPQAPRHLTTQPARAGGVPQPKGNVNFRDEKVRESRFNALAAKYGWES